MQKQQPPPSQQQQSQRSRLHSTTADPIGCMNHRGFKTTINVIADFPRSQITVVVVEHNNKTQIMMTPKNVTIRACRSRAQSCRRMMMRSRRRQVSSRAPTTRRRERSVSAIVQRRRNFDDDDDRDRGYVCAGQRADCSCNTSVMRVDTRSDDNNSHLVGDGDCCRRERERERACDSRSHCSTPHIVVCS